jgi:ribose 5-phosphate isomerase A
VGGGLRIVGVPTSYQARQAAKDAGIVLQEPIDIEAVDLELDGADEVDGEGQMIKGAGGALVAEKLIAAMSRRCVILIEGQKVVPQLGKHPVPVEVIPQAISFVLRALEQLGARARVRESAGKVGPVISDLGNPIIDAYFGVIEDARALDQRLNSLPGVVGHGLFIDLADEVLVARSEAGEYKIERLKFNLPKAWWA